MKTAEELFFLEGALGKCNHTQETQYGTLHAINPYNGECQICGRIIESEIRRPQQ